MRTLHHKRFTVYLVYTHLPRTFLLLVSMCPMLYAKSRIGIFAAYQTVTKVSNISIIETQIIGS
jgi:hypothetical protein